MYFLYLIQLYVHFRVLPRLLKNLDFFLEYFDGAFLYIINLLGQNYQNSP